MVRLLPGEKPDVAKRRIAGPTAPDRPSPPPEGQPTDRFVGPAPVPLRRPSEERFRRVERELHPKMPFWKGVFQPWQPSNQAEFDTGLRDHTALLESAGGVTRPKGTAEDVYDAYQNIYLVTKNMEALVPQMTQYDPEGAKALERAATGPTVSVATLNPKKAVIDAMNSIAEEHPTDYAAFLGTEEGLEELFRRAAVGTLTAPGFMEISLLAPGRTGGELVRGNLPESRWTEILANTVEMVGDPTFIATLAALPPVGLAAKGRLLAEISLGMAAGEEAAETVGAPPLVGALGGGLTLPMATRMLQGITRAGRGIILESAGRNPIQGQPATEARIARGIGPSTVDEMKVAFGMERPAFVERADLRFAEEVLSPAEKALGRHTLTASGPEGELAGRLQWRSGPAGVEIMDVVAIKEGEGVGTSLLRRALDDIRALHPEAEITASLNSASGARLFRRVEGARFFSRSGEATTADRAVELAAAGKGPTVELSVAQVPRTVPTGVGVAEVAGGAKELPAPKGAQALEGQAIYDVEQRRLIKPNELSKEISEQADQFARYGEGHEPYFASQEVKQRGLFGNIQGAYSEVPRLKIEGDVVRIRYDADGYLHWMNRDNPLFAQEYKRNLQATINAVKKEWPGKGILVEDSNEFIPGKLTKALPAAAGGENFWNIELNDTMIRATIERPESRDVLRKAAEGLSHTIPGARRIVDIVNRMAVVDTPHLKAALGWQLGKAWQDSQREIALAALRGKRVPFRENAIGQIWLPKVAGQELTAAPAAGAPTRGLIGGQRPFSIAEPGGRILRAQRGRGPGGWIAVGDVFEDVMRGGKKYIPRLTEEQTAWINEAKRIMAPFTRETEAAMGIKVATREVHWPRFSLDPTAGRWRVHAGQAGRARPPAMFQRIFESQEEAISEFGVRYKPGVVTQMDLYIQGMQRMSRDAVMGQSLRQAGVVRVGRRAMLRETFAELLGPSVPKWTETGPRRELINKELLTDIQTLIGPLSKNPLITVPQKLNAVARLLLTGSMDTGVGAIQMSTLAFAFPDVWAESMARGLYAAVVDPKSIYRFLSTSPAARRFAQYSGNVGLDSEFFEATRLVGQAIPRVPGAQPVLDVATYPARLLVRRMQVGFEGPLLFGRVLAFDAMADAARAPGVVLRAAGARQLEGKALHEEMFRLARFTDTLLGQPKLGGIVATRQAQFESAWVWFATRYTRSILGTLSYMAGTGYTPAQARVVLAKMFVGGASVTGALIAGRGAMEGKSQKEIIEEIRVALDPRSGKKHMAMPVGQTWFGLGGAFRSLNTAIGGLADKKNWNVDEWGDQTEGGARLPKGFFDNPLFRPLRSRTTPVTGTLTDFIEGEDFLGYAVNLGDLVTTPEALWEYTVDNFAPIAIDAFLQGHGDWLQRLPAGIAEFFGLRTSPETAFEALEPVRNRVSNEYYGVDFDDPSLENNRVARQRIHDHPDVVAVLEGRVRPIQDQRVQTAWDKYFTQADDVREEFGTEKEELDKITRTGRMDGRTYRNKYGDVQLREFGELTGLQKALGITFEDAEAPEGTVDAALAAYYAVDLEGKDEDGNFIYYDPDSGEYDWEAWYSDREDALTGLSDTDRADVEWYFRRHETELRRDFRREFDDIIEPSGYLKTRELAGEMTGLSIPALKEIVLKRRQDSGQRAGAGDIWREVDKTLNWALESKFGENAPTLSQLRQTMRKLNPRLDVELFRQGLVTTARTEDAIEIATALQESHPERAYFPPDLAGDVEAKSPKVPSRAPAPAPTPAGFRLPAPTQANLDELFEEATRGGGVSAKIVENVYRGAEAYRENPERGVDPDKFITHELTERLLIEKGVSQPEAHKWVAAAEGRPTGGPSGTQGLAEAQPVVTFLRAGRATHPDEGEVQDEYDLMIGAVETGKNLSEAIRLAQSHLDAHTNALRPEVQGTERDPYPGAPQKNQAAVDGFTRVLAFLRRKAD